MRPKWRRCQCVATTELNGFATKPGGEYSLKYPHTHTLPFASPLAHCLSLSRALSVSLALALFPAHAVQVDNMLAAGADVVHFDVSLYVTCIYS